MYYCHDPTRAMCSCPDPPAEFSDHIAELQLRLLIAKNPADCLCCCPDDVVMIALLSYSCKFMPTTLQDTCIS